ncbi:MAG TPA: RNA polymerase sigma factor [Acidimicrobiia bacterium]|nr:RNA polymerase sigma factor [Acidimicrobiia bacterium]
MEELCNRLARDLDGSFEDLVAAVRDDLYSGLRPLHGPDAEDLAQETLIRAYRALASYDPERIRSLRMRPWLWTIALNLGRNRARDRARRPTPVELEDRHPVEDPEPPDVAAWQARLALLTPTQRRAVVLRHVVDLSYAEIAAATGRPEGTVKADVSRGLARLRSIMEEEER